MTVEAYRRLSTASVVAYGLGFLLKTLGHYSTGYVTAQRKVDDGAFFARACEEDPQYVARDPEFCRQKFIDRHEIPSIKALDNVWANTFPCVVATCSEVAEGVASFVINVIARLGYMVVYLVLALVMAGAGAYGFYWMATSFKEMRTTPTQTMWRQPIEQGWGQGGSVFAEALGSRQPRPQIEEVI